MLFDAGRGVTLRLNEIGMPMNQVTSLFLTHLHSDHIVGLPDLWLTGWIMGRQIMRYIKVRYHLKTCNFRSFLIRVQPDLIFAFLTAGLKERAGILRHQGTSYLVVATVTD